MVVIGMPKEGLAMEGMMGGPASLNERLSGSSGLPIGDWT